MIITCPECSGKFRIDPAALGTDGRTVRCGKCGHQWFQTPPSPEPPVLDEVGDDPAPAPPPLVSKEIDEADVDPDIEFESGNIGETEESSVPNAGTVDEPPVRSRRRTKAAAAAKPGRNWPAVVAWACLVLVVGGIGASLYEFRNWVMDTWPETASLYDHLDLAQPGFGLVLAPPQARQTSVDGKTALVIEGRIENPTKRERMVPKSLRLQLLDKNQQEVQVETFDSPARRLLPEQSIPYKFELKDPAEKRDVLLISFGGEKN